jgi:hypothetical protein
MPLGVSIACLGDTSDGVWAKIIVRIGAAEMVARISLRQLVLRAPIDAADGVLYCEPMRNITVSVDDETYRRARVKAAEQDTSVSALVKRFLNGLATEESDCERLKREERALRDRISAFRAADRLPREDVHGHGA